MGRLDSPPPQNKNYYFNYNTIYSIVLSGIVLPLLATLTPTAVPWPYRKVILSVHIFSWCFLTCIVLSPSGVCYLNFATPVTLLHQPITGGCRQGSYGG